MLVCPVCQKPLVQEHNRLLCAKGHSFDLAKEGYVNLLRSGKNGDLIGDDKASARSRRDFLNKGYYGVLQEHFRELFAARSGTLLDICCGEGYYTSALGHEGLSVYGFDISKEMVRLAAKRGKGSYFVANLAAIPVADASFDYGIHLFAPFQEKEFFRILKPGGRLYTVVPGRQHLYGLKKLIYDTPYENDEQLPETQKLIRKEVTKITANILLKCPEDILAVFRMTPYYFHTSDKDRQKLEGVLSLETPVEFVIAEYQKPGE